MQRKRERKGGIRGVTHMQETLVEEVDGDAAKYGVSGKVNYRSDPEADRGYGIKKKHRK